MLEEDKFEKDDFIEENSQEDGPRKISFFVKLLVVLIISLLVLWSIALFY